MRTNIDIDEALLEEAIELSDLKTKKAVVEEALKAMVLQRRRRKALDELWGIGWEGDLEEMRLGFPSLDAK
ncbi:type II toxin-antitoxin system VapB family antitoxin [Rhizobium sp. KVB221]|uniref:Type II toxin-antitoxin system VapB family antitoxin n=1 Tax=Rhizobium setariae TaxID=2801340 RepID=A0A936YSH7_9HYPH|nr:type II toxin-antitoxin system VapB family antitoxin [Rhizobium setariae]